MKKIMASATLVVVGLIVGNVLFYGLITKQGWMRVFDNSWSQTVAVYLTAYLLKRTHGQSLGSRDVLITD